MKITETYLVTCSHFVTRIYVNVDLNEEKKVVISEDMTTELSNKLEGFGLNFSIGYDEEGKLTFLSESNISALRR